MANDPFVLRHLFEFFVPSQCRCTEPLPDELRQEVLKEVKTRMSNWFGGFTVTDARGGWVLESGELAEESVSIIYSNATDEVLKSHKSDFISLAKDMATRLSQEAIGYRINGKMAFADGDTGIPCLHAQVRFAKMDRRKKETVYWYLSLEGALRKLCKGDEADRRDALFRLFTETLGYAYENKPMPTSKWPKEFRQMLFKSEAPTVIARSESGFKIILIRLNDNRLLLTEQRQVIERLMKDDPTLRGLFVVTDGTGGHWHFVNVPENGTEKRRLLRRFRIEYENQPIRTMVERFSLLDLQRIGEKASCADIKAVFDYAFDVEAITEDFYKNYKGLFDRIQAELFKQTKDRAWAHDYVLQFLNRLMFIYFIQRKRWLGDNPDFLEHFWETYKRCGQPKDSFVKRWLSVLFFEAFNEKFHGGYDYFPESIRRALQTAPYLNGGLFSRNALDEKHARIVEINDDLFGLTISFLEKYNFTVSEDTPLDQEVAVDAEMLGKVYESLVNVSEETDERGDVGIFYTPRTEIDMMCRLTLVDYLSNHLGAERKPLLYDAVFAYSVEEKETADKMLLKQALWPELDRLLRNITVVDPACGSGSFLIGMLQVLDDLIQRADNVLGRSETPYERRKRIIGQSLYGVDVMRWAVDVAELRLWLQLVVETDLKPAELKFRPLLPNLTFKIRQGDSLVQELGGINLAHIKGTQQISATLTGRLTRLKGEKLKFYNNEFESKFNCMNEIEREERNLFLDILKDRKHTLENRLKETRRALATDTDLLGTTVNNISDKNRGVVEAEAAGIEADLAQTKKALDALAGTKDTPFVWDIAFVEIFTGEKAGFDIVIGNPPYVRQENIADPMLDRDVVSTEAKKAYKDKLIRSVYRLWPSFFGINPDKPEHKINAKSDLYIYFFSHGLALLNKKGSFCFITSNSWLDVGYGKDLQEFLIRYGHVKMVVDNQAKRSFRSADVNTVITLLAPPEKRSAIRDDKIAAFVLFKVPFEQAITSEVFKSIEDAQDRCATPEYRVFPVNQKTLYEQGCDVPEDEDDDAPAQGRSRGPLIKVAHYIGNKWGGKYLRAPDIYWTILEKGKGKLVRLGDIAEVRFGIKTGANEFFYLTNEKIQEWGIEAEFLKPVIVSPRECASVEVILKDLKYKAFCCNLNKNEIKGTAALEYIKWGEKQSFDSRPSCRNRSLWYSFPEKEWARVLWPMTHSDRLTVFWNPKRVAVDHRLFEIYGTDDDTLWGSLAWTGQVLFRELYGRANFGQGALDTEGVDIKALCIIGLSDKKIREGFKSSRSALSERNIGNVKDESAKHDRHLLDSVVFDLLSFSKGEREAVYEAAIELVESRLKKADSLNA